MAGAAEAKFWLSGPGCMISRTYLNKPLTDSPNPNQINPLTRIARVQSYPATTGITSYIPS